MKSRLSFLLLALSLLYAVHIPAMAEVEDTGFSDVHADAWYADAVAYVRDNGLMSGTSATVFEPGAPTSRAMLVTILYRQGGSPKAPAATFSDVEDGAWYGGAVGWASAGGIVSGYSGGRFAPNDPVTREQLAAILWRWDGSPAAGSTAAFADRASVSDYAVSAVAWSLESGIISGKSGNLFDPAGLATRAETAAILYRYWNREAPDAPTVKPAPSPQEPEEAAMPKLSIQVGSQTFAATLEDNATTRALLERLPMTITMGELNGNEKYYYLPNTLPTHSQQAGSLRTGDLMLYGSDCLVLFYKSFSSGFSYTRLGTVDDTSGLAAALGDGSVDVTLQVT